MTTTEQQISALVAKVSNKPAPADPEESLFDSGLLDSFVLTDLVGELEQAFSIKVPDSDLNPRKFDSIERMDAYLNARAAADELAELGKGTTDQRRIERGAALGGAWHSGKERGRSSFRAVDSQKELRPVSFPAI